MGKAAKKKKRAQRFDPLARPDAAMQVDDDAEVEVPKLSAHKARHLERKRLQAEAKVTRRHPCARTCCNARLSASVAHDRRRSKVSAQK